MAAMGGAASVARSRRVEMPLGVERIVLGLSAVLWPNVPVAVHEAWKRPSRGRSTRYGRLTTISLGSGLTTIPPAVALD